MARLFGKIAELVRIVFRVDNQEVTLQPNSSTTYTADRTVELPNQNADAELVSTDATQTLTNKTFDVDGAGNSLSNVRDAEIATDADITRTKLAIGTADHVLINDGSGEVSSQAQLDVSKGGTGQGGTATYPTSGTVLTDTSTNTVANKTLNNSNTVTVTDENFTLEDNGDSTKKLEFELSGSSNTTTTTIETNSSADRTIDLPDADDTLVGRATTDTLTNKTLTSAVLNSTISGTSIKDEDNMASDSDQHLATQQSIKAYVDNEVAGAGSSIEVQDESVSLTTAVTKFDFAGAGVTVTEPVADEVLVTIPGGGSSPVTTRGDIIRGDSGGSEERLALGSNGQVLTSDGTDAVWATAPGTSPDSQIRVHTGNGHGGSSSGETRVRNFSTTLSTTGSDITYTARTATTGAKFTINQAGIYTIDYTDSLSTGSGQIGISLNSTQLSTNIQSIAVADRLAVDTATSSRTQVSCTFIGAVNDVIRAHTNGSGNFVDSSDDECFLTITQIAKL